MSNRPFRNGSLYFYRWNGSHSCHVIKIDMNGIWFAKNLTKIKFIFKHLNRFTLWKEQFFLCHLTKENQIKFYNYSIHCAWKYCLVVWNEQIKNEPYFECETNQNILRRPLDLIYLNVMAAHNLFNILAMW